MAISPDARDPFDDLREGLRFALADQPLLPPVETSRPEERRLWRACELATFAEYRLGGIPGLISAGRDGDLLIWEDRRRSEPPDDAFVAPRDAVESTFALWLAVRGWPLIRGPNEWEQRHRWCDIGMPEGLADKIVVFEAYTRHCRFRVEAPRIPGLIYPGCEAL